MPAACMVPCLPWSSCVALGKSYGFLGLQLLIIVKGRASAHCRGWEIHVIREM